MPNSHDELRDTSDQKKAHQERIRKFLADPKIGIENIPDEDLNRYQLAFTHSSVTSGKESYERLEWLGDRVLNLVVAGYLYAKDEQFSEGIMTDKLRCVSNDNLQKFILNSSIFPEGIIQTGNGTSITPNIRADAFESLVGAIFLHKGLDTAREVVLKYFKEEIETFDPYN